MAFPSLVEIVKETGRQGKELANGAAHGAIAFYFAPTVARKFTEWGKDDSKAARSVAFARGVGFAVGLLPGLISVGSGLLTAMYNLTEVSLPYEPRWFAQGWDFFVRRAFPYTIIGGNAISGAYELGRYAFVRSFLRKDLQKQ